MKMLVLFVLLIGHCHAFLPHFASFRRSHVQIGTRSQIPQHGSVVDIVPVVPKESNIVGVELNDELKSSFMSYAVSTILGRALPDVRDGLKPVHRRVLYAMQVLNLTPESSYRKCARIVGEVLGKYHPHGDQSVYDALVRMAQDFVMLHPLVAGHGNFGSVDNDPPAAMRYTEAKLSSLAYDALLADIKEDAVGFVPNFDGNEEEPVVLPARLPLLLLNGASGIAVGMATNVPPHNLGEVADAMVALMENPELSDKELSKIVPAPDFPTGGLILGQAGSRSLHSTGHGSIVMRAKAHMELISSSSGAKSSSTRTRNAIVITELPYMTNKAALLEKIAELVNDKQLEGIADLRDETDREGMRMVIELKKDAVPAVVQNNLFKRTALQTTFSGNMLALMQDGTQPRRITLKEALLAFIKFRFATVRRRSAHRLSKLQARDHVVQGMIRALGRIDEIIRLMKASKDTASAKEALTSPDFGFSTEQAEAIMSLTLRRLTALEEGKLRTEHADLTAQISSLQLLMTQDADVYAVMKAETLELRQKHAQPRRSEVVQDEVEEVAEIDLLANERSVVAITTSGYIKRMPIREFESQSRGGKGRIGAHLTTEKDSVAHFFACNDHDTIIFISDSGKAYTKRAFQIPLAARTARGVPLPQVLPISRQDTVTAAIPISSFNCSDQANLVLLTETGFLKRTPLKAFKSVDSRGLKIMTLASGDKLRWARTCADEDAVLIATKGGFVCRFPAAQLMLRSRTTKGVKSLTLRTGDSLVDIDIVQHQQQQVSTSCAETAPTPTSSSSGSSSSSSVEEITTSPPAQQHQSNRSSIESQSQSQQVLVVTQQGYGKCVSMDALKSQQRRSMGMYVIKFWKPPKASKNSNNNSSSSVVASSSVSDGDGSNNSSSSSSMSKKRKAARSGAGGPVTPDAVSNIRVCGVDDEVVISTRKGIVMRQRIASILVKSRSAKGVLLQDIPEDDRIISVDVVPSVVPAAVPANSGVRATKAGAAMVVGAAREAGGGPGGAAAVKVEVVSGASTSRKGPRGVSKAAKKEEVVG